MHPQNQPPDYQYPEQLSAQDYVFPQQVRVREPADVPVPPQGQTLSQPQAQFQPQAQAQAQPRPSRRSLLRGGLVGGGIGLAAAAGAGAALGVTRNSSSLKPVSKPVVMAPMPPGATQGPLVVYISDTTNGVLDVFAGTGATQIHNPALVAQLLNNLK